MCDDELNEELVFDPAADVESWRLKVPGRAGCFLLEAGDGTPILLATMANVRAALVNRLAPAAADEPTRTTDYRAVTRRVRWRATFGRFEGHWVYMENARRLFASDPAEYRRLIRRWRCAWLCIDMRQTYPQWVVTDRPRGPLETCFGPMPDGRSARRYVQMLEDLFDLCRYHQTLVQAPNGAACAYKEMGKCPAPCDGSVSMEHYRGQLEASIEFVRGGVERWRERTRQRMQHAAAELNFELAGRCKTALGRSDAADGATARHLRPIEGFRWLTLQPGARKGHVRPFIIRPDGGIEACDEITAKDRDPQIASLIEPAAAAHERAIGEIDAAGAERLGLAAWHLFMPGKSREGRWLRGDAATDAAAITKAIASMQKDAARRGAEADVSSDA